MSVLLYNSGPLRNMNFTLQKHEANYWEEVDKDHCKDESKDYGSNISCDGSNHIPQCFLSHDEIN